MSATNRTSPLLELNYACLAICSPYLVVLQNEGFIELIETLKNDVWIGTSDEFMPLNNDSIPRLDGGITTCKLEERTVRTMQT